MMRVVQVVFFTELFKTRRSQLWTAGFLLRLI
jgi:hypothetical protein